jgi:hypothetical protein
MFCLLIEHIVDNENLTLTAQALKLVKLHSGHYIYNCGGIIGLWFGLSPIS